jgi:glucose/mannose-6-phosphate isomerase
MLDILNLKNSLDSHDMYRMIADMPRHLDEGMIIGQDVDLKNLEIETFHSIVVSGMGGSAIAGDLIKVYLMDAAEIPFIVCRHYKLPAFVNKKTLVVCSSYSGDTEETLSAYDDAMIRGAKVIAITTGGKLEAKGIKDGIPIARLKKGLPPRAALGYSFASLLTILGRLGICAPSAEEISNMELAMKKWAERYKPDAGDNPALKLAEEIHGRIPIIYAGCENLDAVAVRFKGQISENAKCLAFANVFPELNHNELVGWNMLNNLEDKLIVILLKDKEDHKRVKARMDIVIQYLKDRGIKILDFENENGSKLERMFYFIQYLDFASYYLALLNGLDPFPVKAIDYLKERLLAID